MAYPVKGAFSAECTSAIRYDWSEVKQDPLNEEIRDIFYRAQDRNFPSPGSIQGVVVKKTTALTKKDRQIEELKNEKAPWINP